MYKNIISIGFFCSVASELQRMHLRSRSGPLDWVISDLSGVLELIKNNFKDLLNPNFLVQNPVYPYIITNTKYAIDFYHDFLPTIPFNEQVASVQSKYESRIKHFYQDISMPTLFVRYIKDQAEYDFICREYENIIYLLRYYNTQNNLILIGNTEIISNRISMYKVEKDIGDTVARQFVDKNKELMQLLSSPIISQRVRNANIEWQIRKNKKK